MYSSHNAPVLVGFARGAHAANIEKMSDSEVVAAALSDLKKLFPDAATKHLAVGAAAGVTSFAITRWASDPFARGAYSGLKAGAGGAAAGGGKKNPGARKTLFEPCAPLFFAGEG